MRRRKVLQLGAAATAAVVAAPAVRLVSKPPAPLPAADSASVIVEVIDISAQKWAESMGGRLLGAPRPVNLVWSPIVPGTLVVTDGNQTLMDDGQGNLVGDGSGRVNYYTGALDGVQFNDMTSAVDRSFGGCSPVTATYRHDNESGYTLI